MLLRKPVAPAFDKPWLVGTVILPLPVNRNRELLGCAREIMEPCCLNEDALLLLCILHMTHAELQLQGVLVAAVESDHHLHVESVGL
jgi:hypothetical protein